MENKKKGIFKLNFDCGRQGSLEGIFVANIEDVAELVGSGRDVYFGEVLGKHSDIGGTIDENEIDFITDEKEVVEIFEKYNLQSGYNPFDFLD